MVLHNMQDMHIRNETKVFGFADLCKLRKQLLEHFNKNVNSVKKYVTGYFILHFPHTQVFKTFPVVCRASGMASKLSLSLTILNRFLEKAAHSFVI